MKMNIYCMPPIVETLLRHWYSMNKVDIPCPHAILLEVKKQ